MTYPSRRARGRTSGFFTGILGCVLMCCSPAAFGQSQTGGAAGGSGAGASQSAAEISDKIDQLTRSLEQTQVELAESRTEIQELRATLKQVLERMNSGASGGNGLAATNAGAGVQPNGQAVVTGSASGSGSATATASQQVATDESKAAPAQISQDDWDILNARVDEQRQVKVESMSRYRVKLSGLALVHRVRQLRAGR